MKFFDKINKNKIPDIINDTFKIDFQNSFFSLAIV